MCLCAYHVGVCCCCATLLPPHQVPFVTQASVAQGKLRPNSLVRYRGLVQDMFDPEFYVGVFQETLPSGEKRTRHSRYVDVAPEGMGDRATDFDPEKTFQR